MEKLRCKQAQNLIEKAAKSKIYQSNFKKAHEGKINPQIIGEIINEMMDLEDFIYTSRPTHFLKQEDAQDCCNKIILIRNKLDKILADFGVIEQLNVEKEIKSLSSEYLILTTKSNYKKALIKLSVDPRRIIVAGVPLHADDMRKINPHLPDSALKSIEKKIKHVKNDIKRKKEQFKIGKVLVVAEKDKTGEMLFKRAEELYEAKNISVKSLKDITPDEFLKLLSKV